MIVGRYLQGKILVPVLDLLRQGLTPEKIALCVALGITLGIIPVLGSTSILCFLVAALFRLNLPAIQLVNFLVYPFQIALLIPFMRMGGWLFSVSANSLTLKQILTATRQNVWVAMETLWIATLHALVAWLFVAAIVSPPIYWAFASVLRHLNHLPQTEAA